MKISNRTPISTIASMLLLVVLLTASCVGKSALPPTPSPAPAGKPSLVIETRLSPTEREAIFDTVWQTVNDGYFDPTFGGKDWRAIGERYRQMLGTVSDDTAFWLDLLNPMLFELGVSHLAALPAELSSQMEPMTFSAGTLGMDVRVLDDETVVTQVMPSFPADKAGIRPGMAITSVNGRTPEEIAAETLHSPPNNPRNQRANRVQGMRSLFYGEPGSKVEIGYRDADSQPHTITLAYAPRSTSSCAPIDPALPPACAEVEAKRLASGYGYIRFSGFLPAVLTSVLEAIEDMQDTPGLIIDLRGNPGGVFPVRKAIASKLVGEPKLFMRYQRRDHVYEAYLDPVTDPYQGQVVVLVDELTASSSEEFSGSLQALGRATVAGSQTPGRCLVAEIKELPKGAVLIYPYGQSQAPNGWILEDNGVIPDVAVDLNRQALLQGIDSQLEAALRALHEG